MPAATGWNRADGSAVTVSNCWTQAHQIEQTQSFADDAPQSEARNDNPRRRQIQS